jgi:hypothetical protein
MRPLLLLSVLMLTACGGGALTRGGDAPACASVASKQKAVDRIDKDYEELRQRIVDAPTEKNQQKLAEMATESAAAKAALDAAEAEQAAGRCPQD